MKDAEVYNVKIKVRCGDDYTRLNKMSKLVSEFYAEVMRFKPSLYDERARIFTQSYMESEGLPQIVRRAKAIRDVLEGMSINILKGELIVGNQASRLRAAPLFPEFSISFFYIQDMRLN